jgi:NDP-sugar pyrophosphorylase family protein
VQLAKFLLWHGTIVDGEQLRKITRAMVLCAGGGTRLRPLTVDVPKPMAPIVGTPLVGRTLAWLAHQGITLAAVNLWHRPEVIVNSVGPRYSGVDVRYFAETELMGTAGGVKAAEDLFRDGPFCVIYGDNLIDVDLMALVESHLESGAEATVGLFHHPNPTAAGIVAMDANGFISRFVEKPAAKDVFSDLANAGVYVLEPSVLDLVPSGKPWDFARDVFPEMVARRRPIKGMLLNGYLQDTGTPALYRKSNWDFLAGCTGTSFDDKELWIHPRAVIADGVSFIGRNIVGAGCTIGTGATLRDSILWDNVRVGENSCLNNAILGHHVDVESGAHPAEGIIAGSGERLSKMSPE